MLIKSKRNTLKKKYILKNRKQIVQTLKYGKLFKQGSIKINIYHHKDEISTNNISNFRESNYKVAFLVNKRLGKKAVTRNYIKRVLRELFRVNKDRFSLNSLIIITVTTKYDLVDYKIMKQDFDGLLASEKYNDFFNKTLSENILPHEGK